jgi:hypothetical protein
VRRPVLAGVVFQTPEYLTAASLPSAVRADVRALDLSGGRGEEAPAAASQWLVEGISGEKEDPTGWFRVRDGGVGRTAYL